MGKIERKIEEEIFLLNMCTEVLDEFVNGNFEFVWNLLFLRGLID